MCWFFCMGFIHQSFSCSGWEMKIKSIEPLPLTKLVGSSCWSRVCDVCTWSWKKDVLYLKYFLGSTGTVLTAFPVNTVFLFFSKKVIAEEGCKSSRIIPDRLEPSSANGINIQGVNMEQGMILDFSLLCSPQLYPKTSNIRTYFNHALTNGLSSKIDTDFCSVHTRLCYKYKNDFIHQYMTLRSVLSYSRGWDRGFIWHISSALLEGQFADEVQDSLQRLIKVMWWIWMLPHLK